MAFQRSSRQNREIVPEKVSTREERLGEFGTTIENKKVAEYAKQRLPVITEWLAAANAIELPVARNVPPEAMIRVHGVFRENINQRRRLTRDMAS